MARDRTKLTSASALVGMSLFWADACGSGALSASFSSQPAVAALAPEVVLAAQQPSRVPKMLSGMTYQSRAGSISFGRNGTFRLAGSGLVPSVAGKYQYSRGLVTFSDPNQAVSGIDFPVRCRIEPGGTSFMLHAVDGSCEAFNGLMFERIE